MVHSDQPVLAAFLLQEKSKGTGSFFYPYIDMLPKSYRHMPALFSEEELSHLQGSFSLPEITRLRQGAQWEYRQMCLAVPAFAQFPPEEYFWARLVVITRVFGITVGQVSTSALVPLADMLNHKRPPETHWTFSNMLNCFTIKALKGLTQGEQVYDSYGRKSNADFFLNYGFLSDHNMYDQAEVHVVLPQSDPLYAEKNIYWGGEFNFKTVRLSCGHDLKVTCRALGFFRLLVANAAELEIIRLQHQGNIPAAEDDDDASQTTAKSAQTIKGEAMADSVRAVNLRNELAALQALAEACRTAAGQFSSTLQEDVALLSDETADITRNVRNCVLVRMSEKNVLHSWNVLAERANIHCASGNTLAQATQGLATDSLLQTSGSDQDFPGAARVRYVSLVLRPLLNRASEMECKRSNTAPSDSTTVASVLAQFQNMSLQDARAQAAVPGLPSDSE
jgi:histone-lysine N-methyltransferase SETD3